ncbi:MAG: O-antigen ligase family protein [Rhodospirillales bacterium]|nr:O-antigen ligase family protein [Rhodospirillales bacterium]
MASPLPLAPGNPYAILLLLLPYAWMFRISILAERKADITQVGGYQLLQIVLVLLTVAAVVASQRAPQLWQISRGRPAAIFLYYYIFCLLTAAASAFPQYAVYRSVEYIALFSALMIGFSYQRNFFSAERALLILLMAVIVTNAIGRSLLVGFSFSLGRWHANDFPAGGAMLFCYCVGEYFGDNRDRRLRLLLGAAFGGFFMVLGTSTGSFAAAAIGLLVIAYFRRSLPMLLGGGALAVVLVLLMALGAFQTQDVLDVVAMGKTEKHLENASGRLPIWEYYFHNYVIESPIIGHGLGTLSQSGTGELVKAQPHASFMSVLLYTGAVGMLFYVTFIIRCVNDGFWACQRRLPGAVGCVAALAAGFVNSQTNPFIFDIFEETSIVFSSFIALFALFVVIPGKRQEAGVNERRPPAPLLPKAKPHAHHLRRPLVP